MLDWSRDNTTALPVWCCEKFISGEIPWNHIISTASTVGGAMPDWSRDIVTAPTVWCCEKPSSGGFPWNQIISTASTVGGTMPDWSRDIATAPTAGCCEKSNSGGTPSDSTAKQTCITTASSVRGNLYTCPKGRKQTYLGEIETKQRPVWLG